MPAAEPVFADDARFLAETHRPGDQVRPAQPVPDRRPATGTRTTAATPTRRSSTSWTTWPRSWPARPRALVEAGIDIVQIDDPALTYFCDRDLMAGAGSHDERLRRDWDADRQFPQAVAAINRVADGLRAEVHLHCCHSVYKRRSDVTRRLQADPAAAGRRQGGPREPGVRLPRDRGRERPGAAAGPPGRRDGGGRRPRRARAVGRGDRGAGDAGGRCSCRPAGSP